ncbi:MAG: hypothetical protein A2017_01705 [Lentisphaerae bacterium GWF2_44_16]|nr:MAG: hypothetical protein A2017_01705 [Lentisphaerae bacterium GWF2_44_16]
MQKFSLGKNKTIKVRSLFIAEHIDIRAMEITGHIASSPLTLKLGENGCVILFRYGALVFFNTDPIDEMKCLTGLKPLLEEPFASPKVEEVEITVSDESDEGVRADTIFIKDFSIERLQLIAEILSKTVVLEYYETSVSRSFDSIEPIAIGLKETGRCGHEAKDLLRHIGESLLSMHKMIGRVQISEKPDVLWEHPKLERLYVRLQEEYELRERHLAVDQKLELISRTAETVLDLLEHKHSSRLEWYIIILIVFEIILSLYDMFLHPVIMKMLY